MKKVSRVLLVMLLIFVMFFNITVKANDDYSTLNGEEISGDISLDEKEDINLDRPIEAPSDSDKQLSTNQIKESGKQIEIVETVSDKKTGGEDLVDESSDNPITDDKGTTNLSEPTEESETNNLDNPSNGETKNNNIVAAIANESSEPTDESKNNNLDNSSGETESNNTEVTIVEEPTNANNESDGIDTGEVVPSSVPVAKSETILRSTSSTNMADYLTGVTINAPKVGNNIYQIVPGTRYEVSLHFSEGENLQFPNFGRMTYQLPSGFENVLINGGQVDIVVTDGGQNYTVSGNTYSISNGVVTFTWNTSDSNFQRLIDATNAQFSMDFSGSFDQNYKQIEFSSDVVANLLFEEPTPGKLELNKTGNWNPETNTINYTITVKASGGALTNVVVTDTMDGRALIFNQDVSIAGNSSAPIESQITANGFVYKFPSMNANETITITYTASIDSNQLNPIVNKGKFTYDETNNKVKVKSDEEPDEVKKEFYFVNEYSSMNKGGELSPDGKSITWTINLNKEQFVSIAGATVTDTITESSRGIMHYSGSGITIVVTKEDGTTETRNVSWADVGMTGEGDYSWTYNVPTSDGKYSYVITYTTSVDNSTIITTTPVSNTSEGPGKDTGVVNIEPSPDHKLDLTKEVQEQTEEKVTWKISFNLPANTEFNNVELTDIYPAMWNGNNHYIDSYVNYSISVAGLKTGEGYNLDTSSSTQAVIRFYKDANQTPGLLSDTSMRTITVTLQTKFDENWIQAGLDQGGYYTTHTNNAKLNVNGKILYDNASVDKGRMQKNYIGLLQSADPNDPPVYVYDVVVGGVTQDTFEVIDNFNTTFLEFNPNYPSTGYLPEDNMAVSGGLMQYSQTIYLGKATARLIENGVIFTVPAFKDANDNYYNYYRIRYFLVVKDEEALKEAALNTSDGKVILNNTASFGGNSASADAEYTYKVLNKELVNKGELGGKNRRAEYVITFNPDGRTLNNGNDITITDTFSQNLNILYDTISFSNPDDVITYNVSGNVGTFVIKDGRPVTITYTAIVIGMGNQKIVNEAKALRYEDSEVDQKVYENSGEGTASVARIKILKQEKGKMDVRLAGAVFQLWNVNNQDNLNDDTPVLDKNGNEVFITTDENGTAIIDAETLNFDFYFNHPYYLLETVAPRGYNLSDTQWKFTLVNDDASINTYKYIYPADYTMRINNTPEAVEIPVVKVWTPGSTTKSVTIRLMNGTTQVGTITLNGSEETPWKYTFTGLDKYDANGNVIAYTITEDTLAGYSSVVDGYTVTNKELTEIPVVKVWTPGSTTKSVTIRLMNGTTQVGTITLNGSEETPWHYTFTGLDKYDSEGNAITYTITEDTLAGYSSVVDGYTVTNKELTEIPVVKVWTPGSTTKSVTIRLMNGTTEVGTITLNGSEETPWHYTFTGLDKYDANGNVIAYTITEDTLAGYSSVVDGYTVTNKELTEIPVVKVWTPGSTTKSVTIRLMNGTTQVGTITLNGSEETPWKYTFTGLDKYDANGNVIAYTITEDTLAGYSSVVDGYTVTNKELTEIPVVKVWTPGSTTKSVTIRLMNGTTEVGTITLNGSEETPWHYTFTGLDKYDANGNVIAYTITEDTLAGYSSVVDGYTVTNKELTEIPVVKVWTPGSTTKSVTIRLMNGTTQVGTITLNGSEETPWKYTFTGLDKYDANGNVIAYTITEDTLAGYSSVVDGYTVTNKELTEIPVVKVWTPGSTTKSVTIRLMNGTTQVGTITLNGSEETPWKYTFTGLDKYDSEGNAITYTITEDTLAGYSSVVDGYTVTNKELTEIPVVKVWTPGSVTKSVTIRLMNGTTQVGTITLNGSEETPWKYTFTGLDKYDANGNVIAYTITEDTLAGYSSVVDGYTVTNKELTEIPVVKVWTPGSTTKSVTIRLMNGTTEVGTITLNGSEETPWHYTFTGLDKYDANGNVIAYTITEDTLAGYSSVVDGYTVTNKELTEIPVVKVWTPGSTTKSVTIRLMNGTTQVGTITLNGSEETPWKYTFTGLDKYDSEGNAITYTITEDTLAGYSSVVDGYTVTNKELTEIPVVKVWTPGSVTKSVTIRLMNGTTQVGTITLNGSEETPWKYTFTGLDKYDANGNVIAYTITEDTLAGYSSVVDGYTVTNKELTEIPVVKVWTPGSTTKSVTIRLMNGTTQVGTITLNGTEETPWKYTFTGLDKYDSEGNAITYTITEDTLAGYSSVVDGYTVTNKELTEIPVVKVWTPGSVTKSVTIRLMNGTTQVGTITLNGTEETPWKYTFTGLDKYDSEGNAITYTITEDTLAGYSSVIDGYTVTNKELTEIPVVKVWTPGSTTKSVTIRLMNGTTQVGTITLNGTEETPWKYTFTGLDKYDSEGNAITYTITEDTLAGYSSVVDGYTVTNKELTEIPVVKVWTPGSTTKSVTIRLMNGTTEVGTITLNGSEETPWHYTFTGLDKYDANGNVIAYTITEDTLAGYSSVVDGYTVTNKELTEIPVVKVWTPGSVTKSVTIRLMNGTTQVGTITLNGTEETPWHYTFTGLDKYDANGNVIAYTITEDTLAGYSSVVDGYTVTNKELTEIPVEKKWIAGNETTEVTIRLMNGTTEVGTITLDGTEETPWKYTFTGLDKYDSKGNEIEYTITEDELEGYETTIEEFIVTNIKLVDATIIKVWSDDNNRDGIRPTSLQVQLLADGEKVENGILTLEENEDGIWTGTITGLIKYNEDGSLITYAWMELDLPEGYELTDTTVNGIITTLTNTHTPEKREITVEKVWDDKEDYEHLRPVSVTINLYADDVLIETVELTEENGWFYKFKDLDVYNKGSKIIYTIDEKKVVEYDTNIEGNMDEGFTIINSHYGTGGDETPTDNPQTSDSIIIYIMMLVISLLGLFKCSYSYAKNY